MLFPAARPADISLLAPADAERRFGLRQIALSVACTALVALCAHISFVLPFTPVPVTMQTFAVLLIGMLLGPAAGAATMVLYLAEGAAGLPVFSPHGPGGFAQLAGPSAGYLLAYPVAALLAGALFATARRALPVALATLAAALLADSVILASGSAWLAGLLHVSSARAMHIGALPFLAGEAFKLTLLAGTIASLEHARRTR